MCDLHVVLSVNMQENDMKISLRQIFDRTVICYSVNVRIEYKQLGVDNWRLIFSVELIVELFASRSAAICVRPTRLKAITSVSATVVNV